MAQFSAFGRVWNTATFGNGTTFGTLSAWKVWVRLLDSGVWKVELVLGFRRWEGSSAGTALGSGMSGLGRGVGSRPGWMREVRMSTYVSCVGMSTHVSWEHSVYKEDPLLRIVLFLFLSHATSCILFEISNSSPFPSFSLLPLISSFSATLASVLRSHWCVHPTLSVLVRHVRPTLFIPV